MPDTTASRVNGQDVTSRSQVPTGGEVVQHKSLSLSPIRVVEPVAPPGETIAPEKLYQYFSQETGRFEVDAPIGVISKTLGEVLERLRQAGQESGELQRENHIALAWSVLYALVPFLGNWPSFDDAMSVLFAAIQSHRSSPYQVSELIPLRKVLEMLRRNPAPTDQEITLICEVLETADFDLNAPMRGIDLREEAEEL